MIADETQQLEKSGDWQQPPLDKKYVLYDKDRVSYALCSYAHLLGEIDSDFWPKRQEDYDLLLFSFDAWELDE